MHDHIMRYAAVIRHSSVHQIDKKDFIDEDKYYEYHIDKVIIYYIITEFNKVHGVDLRNDFAAYERVKDVANKARIDLVSAPLANSKISLSFICVIDDVPRHLERYLTLLNLKEISDFRIYEAHYFSRDVKQEGDIYNNLASAFMRNITITYNVKLNDLFHNVMASYFKNEVDFITDLLESEKTTVHSANEKR